MKLFLKLYILILFIIISTDLKAAIGDTILVNTFSNAVHQNCNTIVQTFNFPSDTNHYEKIMLNYKLACPAGIGCDPYDRIGILKAYKKTGVFDSTLTEILEPFEIMRMITPYGMGVNLWVDVSDYRSLFNDSVKMSTIICGYANGWSVTANFYMIKGKPIREAYKIENLWKGTFQYGNPSDPIESHLQPITKTIDSAAVSTKLRVVTTGHGFNCDPDPNVAEFSEFTDTLFVNGTPLLQHLWRDDCGANPLYPQPMSGAAISTWFYNRANWCPGTWVRPHDYDITALAPAGASAVLDYNMVPYTNTGGPNCSYAPEYWIQTQLVYYRAPSYLNNVELMYIRQPNTAFDFRRMNPICSGVKPLVLIKNNGTNPLTAITFQMKQDTVNLPNYTWTGNVAFLDTASIELPALSISTGAHTFEVRATLPNGQLDEFDFDNFQRSNFNSTNVYPNNVIRLLVVTDNTASESSCELKDAAGNVLYSHGPYASNNTLYKDTFYLSDGCYSFTMYDSFGDGMCCYNGNGLFRLVRGLTGNSNIVNTGDFGAFKTVNFTIQLPNGVKADETQNKFTVFPNPSQGLFSINFNSLTTKQFNVDVFDVYGNKVFDENVANSATNVFQINLSDQPNGMYLIRLRTDKGSVSKRVILSK
jgi:Peptide-N-glycosidase F, C terminal/Secretion system C-terminal sorting domain